MPRRSCLTQLAAQAAELREKGVEIVAVHAAEAEREAVSQGMQENRIPFKSGTIIGDIDRMRAAWSVNSLPHLVLAAEKHTVVAEGFGLDDLDRQTEAAAGQ